MIQNDAIFLCFLQLSREEKMRVVRAAHSIKPKKFKAIWTIEAQDEQELQAFHGLTLEEEEEGWSYL